MDRISIHEFKNKNLLEVNYSDLKESDMIELLNEVKETIMKNQKAVLILNIINSKNFATPAFILKAREVTRLTLPFIEKMAFVGLSATQKILLLGFNIFFERNFRSFDTREQAIAFLTDENTTDKDLPDYYRKRP